MNVDVILISKWHNQPLNSHKRMYITDKKSEKRSLTIAFKTPWWVLAAGNPGFSTIFPHLIWYTYALSCAILFSEVTYLKWLDCLLERMYDVTALEGISRGY